MSSSNITVDDQDPSVIYTGPTWKIEPGCTDCSAIPPDTSNVFDKTYHDGRLLTTNSADSLTAQLTFNGTAIYVYGITVNSTSPTPVVKNQNLLFSVDNGPSKQFTFTPNGPNYNFNVLFFAQSNLAPTQHTVKMSVQNNSFVLLDYFVYTPPSSDPASSSSSNGASAAVSGSSTPGPRISTAASSPTPSDTSKSAPVGTIVGAVIGALGGVTIVAFLIFLIRYYRQGDQPKGGSNPQVRSQPGTLPGTNSTGRGPSPYGGGVGAGTSPSAGGATSAGAAGTSAGTNPGPASTIFSALTPGRNKNKNRVGPGAVEPFIIPPQRPPPPDIPAEKGGASGLIGSKSSSSIQRPSTSIDPPTSSSGAGHGAAPGAAGAGAVATNSSSSKRRRRRSRSKGKERKTTATAQNPSNSSNAPSSDRSHSNSNPAPTSFQATNTNKSSSGPPRSEAGSAITHPDLLDSGIRASHWKPPPPLPDVKEPLPPPPPLSSEKPNPNANDRSRTQSQPQTPPPMPLPSPPAGAAQSPARTPLTDETGVGGGGENPYEVAFKRVQNTSTGSDSVQRRARPLPQPQPPPPAY